MHHHSVHQLYFGSLADMYIKLEEKTIKIHCWKPASEHNTYAWTIEVYFNPSGANVNFACFSTYMEVEQWLESNGYLQATGEHDVL